ncbi:MULTISPECIES: hypothetical protein [unclassified Curtobacterium]|uniref:hypothetical protein n=1 Tax=unclassified Curtobacterium TaxID=257496 RepID=UPI0015E8B012|nr:MULTISPECIES: hypothetical protein [unclassified Curtobacterium]WIB34906.1 hypothetical protein DEJ15_10180 [Curtobacterium sp. MCJR17_043]
MSRTPKGHDAIVPMPPAPVQTAPSADGQRVQSDDTSGWTAWLDRAISVQRPVVVAHVARVRRRHPDASPAEVIEILERQYLTAVTSGGAAVGASAVIPGVGMVASLGLSGAETVGFLEASALFAQSVTEVHGITVEDPERARALVMAMMLGAPGTQLVQQLAGEARGGKGRTAFWGELVTSSLPKQAVSGIGGKLRNTFVKRFLTRQGTSVLGRAIPFGIGAVVGGLGNHALGRKVVQSSRSAFGPPPAHFAVVVDAEPVGSDSAKPLSKRQQRKLDR